MTYYEPGSSLNLDYCLTTYEELRSEYWTKHPTQSKLLPLIDGVANSLLRGSTELVAPGIGDEPWSPFTWEQIRWLAEDAQGFSEIVQERIEIDVAREFCLGTLGMAERCVELARVVVKAQPNTSVMRFLRRLSRCYVAGFLPECVMLCRAVVENALVQVLDKKRLQSSSLSGGSTMRNKIELAKAHALLSNQAASDAWIIWKRGSKAAHEDPEATKEVLATIEMSMSVLRELYTT